MARRREAPVRPVMPDSKYNNTTLEKFIKRMMVDGKKSTSAACIYGALGIVKEKGSEDELQAFLKALENIRPAVEVKSRRVGGSTYQVPVEIRDSRRDALAMRWLIAAARKRSGRSMSEKLSAEIMDASNSTGTAFKKKEDTHRMAEANKAFSHYKW
ncbi:30S ribosomal protein S7 [Oceanispirochaeta sp.]|jgi:small subunit ribosomal protein S7|uniref:30S ribosomal protein S7 n=1 Tax=Oceanispirochaeta sp. TaxID=2035350 RepID=UPI0026200210|nr:30S ribosomal protein S7 [Oceanispirochaeta sp.]MDA3958455.1 30S ribosomal protein S7 [Oceanispirochaeta sp.]